MLQISNERQRHLNHLHFDLKMGDLDKDEVCTADAVQHTNGCVSVEVLLDEGSPAQGQGRTDCATLGAQRHHTEGFGFDAACPCPRSLPRMLCN